MTQIASSLVTAKQQAALDEQVIAAQKQQIADLTARLTAAVAAQQAAQSAPAPAPDPAPAADPAPTSDELTRAAAHAFGLALASALAGSGPSMTSTSVAS